MITANQGETDGITPEPTIRYMIGNGVEQTCVNGATIDNVFEDIVAWAVADGFSESDKVREEYVPAYPLEVAWEYNLDNYPSSTGITNIADAIDADSKKTLNELDVYNLKGIDVSNLYVENGDGWLLRKQTGNAFKAQSAVQSIAFDNVTTDNIIYVNARRDGGGNAINGVTNGEIIYTYGDNEYFIAPTADGAVNVAFRTGVSVNTVSVNTIAPVTLTIGDAGVATYTPSVALDFTNARNIVAYKATAAADGVVSLTKVEQVAAGEGVLIYSMTKGAASEEIPVAAETVEKSADNMFVGTLTDIEALATVDGDAVRYILNDGAEGLGFYRANNQKVGAGKAYLSVPAASAAKISFFSLDGTVTAIEGVEAEAAEGDKVFYNLSGQRVENPAKGLYIVNDKKVIIK